MSYGQQINRNNISPEVVKLHWKRSAYLLFLEISFANMKPPFSGEKRSLKRSFPKFPNAFEQNQNKIKELNQCLMEK